MNRFLRHLFIFFANRLFFPNSNPVNKFGHSMSFDSTCDILTGIAESAIEKSKLSSLLPLSPQTPNEVALTFFWVDNFDLKTDTQYGGGLD